MPCCTHVGPDGAGHFVKMVHNGIEYADMQLIAEAYDLLRAGLGRDARPRSRRSSASGTPASWSSFLIEITADVLAHIDAETGKPFVDVVLDQAEQKGTGRWTVQSALDLGVPITGIAEAVFARSLSGHADQRDAARAAFAGRPARVAGRRRPGRVRRGRPAGAATPPRSSPTRRASTRSAAGSQEYGWDIDLGAMATIWRGGCIIRAKFLDRIREAYDADSRTCRRCWWRRTSPTRSAPASGAWRRVVATRPGRACRRPAFSSSLAYYDGLRARAAAGRADPGAARQLRRAHLPAGGPRGLVPHPLGRRPHRVPGLAGAAPCAPP